MRNTILVVVDDDKISRMLPSILLRPYGITVIECDTGMMVLDAIKVHCVHYMLIDISMPGINGIDLVKQIRNCSKYEKNKE